jgi:hypothetical protein
MWLLFFILLTRCVIFCLVTVQIHNDCTCLIWRQQTAVLYAKPDHIPFSSCQKHTSPVQQQTQLSSDDYLETSWKKVFFPPSIRTSTCLLYEPKWFYDPNPFTKCESSLTAQYIVRTCTF